MAASKIVLSTTSTESVIKIEKSLELSDDFNCLMNGKNKQIRNENDSKYAALKIFASVMLNAWRRRRADVHRLNDENDQLKKAVRFSQTTIFSKDYKEN